MHGPLRLPNLTGMCASNQAHTDIQRETWRWRGLELTPVLLDGGARCSESVTTEKILTSAVTEPKLGAGAVTSAKIKDETILASDIATGAVTSAELMDGTIATVDIATGAVTTAKLKIDNGLEVGTVHAHPIIAWPGSRHYPLTQPRSDRI